MAGNTKAIVKEKRREYAKEWALTSRKHEEDGDYAWMASFVEGCDLLLEVGCGSGSATLELAKRGHRVVSVEENPHCIERAASRLREAGVPVEVELRGSLSNFGNSYRDDYAQIEKPLPPDGVLLVEGLLGYDDHLTRWLLKTCPFDAIVCWLIGGQPAIGVNALLRERASVYYQDSRFHLRFAVQNRLYELADGLLRKDGLLHIVDRGELPDSELLRNDFINGHRDQASPTSLVVERLDSRPWTVDGPGVQMVNTPGLSGRIAPSNKMALNSVISRKP
jgi:SAM-dependent methyltransferase